MEDRQSRIARQTINDRSRRKSTAKAKLKAASQQERVKLWKQHFENLLGNPPKVTNEPISRIISKQLDIKLAVVLGWIISLCVGPGIEPATFRFQSKALITPLPSLRSSSTMPKPGTEPATFRFQSKVLVTPLPSLRSSSTFLLSLSRSPFHSLCASSFVSLPPASASRREKKDARKEKRVGFYLCHLTHNPFP